jgi:hypothetical protein
MITKNIIFKTLAISYLTFITSGTVFANSNNDKPIYKLKSQFSKNLYSKIERKHIYTNPRHIFNLNNFEEKKFNNYGIEAGNNLSPIVENIDVIFEKTSKDIKITVKRTSGGLIFLKYMHQENIEKEILNKEAVEDNI